MEMCQISFRFLLIYNFTTILPGKPYNAMINQGGIMACALMKVLEYLLKVFETLNKNHSFKGTK